MTTALVLSGGGAKGAFQVGALEVLEAEGFKYDLLYGVSVGALNTSILAKYDFTTLKDIWMNIKEEDIHKRYNWPKIIWRIANGKKGVFDNTPLRKTLEKYIGEDTVQARVGLVSLTTGEYYSTLGTVETIFASATMPVVWEPVKGDWVDGGVRNVTPLAEAIKDGADRIVVILCNPLSQVKSAPPKDLIDVAKRSLDLAMNEIAQNDVKETLRINALVGQAAKQGVTLYAYDGRPFKHVDITLIEPLSPLGDTLDFSPRTLRSRMIVGRIAANRALGLK